MRLSFDQAVVVVPVMGPAAAVALAAGVIACQDEKQRRHCDL